MVNFQCVSGNVRSLGEAGIHYPTDVKKGLDTEIVCKNTPLLGSTEGRKISPKKARATEGQRGDTGEVKQQGGISKIAQLTWFQFGKMFLWICSFLYFTGRKDAQTGGQEKHKKKWHKYASSRQGDDDVESENVLRSTANKSR